MVARSASSAPGFVPADRPRVAIAGDGTLAVISEATRAVVVELPGGVPFAEIGTDPEAAASEIAWVGTPPRLLVLSRFAAHSTVHLIDPHGPRTIAEIRLEAPMRLFASVGAHALAVGSVGAAVLTATDTHLTPYQFPARTFPVTAGAAAGNFVVALAGSIEEWDPASRMPKRRLRLPKPAVITAVGGSDRVVWMMTQADPTRVDVIPLVNRGQPKTHELPEPIAHISGHPRSDLIVCVGADSGKVYVVDLDGRTRLRVVAAEGIDRATAAGLVIGRHLGVLAVQAHKPISIAPLEGREGQVDAPAPAAAVATQPDEPPRRSTLGADEPELEAVTPPSSPPPPVARATAAPAARPPSPPTPVGSPPVAEAAPSRFRHRTAAAPVKPVTTAQNLSERFSAWRVKMRQPQPRSEQAAALPSMNPRPSWRDELVTWARAVTAGSVERGAPASVAIEAIAVRFELALQLVPALALLYGAHLGGERGAAPFDVARVLGRRWDEALGTGQLAARGLARYADSRVLLAGPIQRALDELPVTTGTMAGEPGLVALLGPCVVVSPDAPLAVLAERHRAAVGGAILAAFDDSDPGELFIEARARGAAPMLRIGAGDILELGTDPAVLVVTDDAIADQLGVPKL